MKKIKENIETAFSVLTKKASSGFVEGFFGAIASVLDEFYKSLEYYRKQHFILTAKPEFLSLIAGELLEKEGAKRAEGDVVFFGDVDAIIPTGTILKIEEIEYTTTGEGIIYDESFEAVASVTDTQVELPANLNIPSCEATVNGEKVFLTSFYDGIYFNSENVEDGSTITVKINKSDKVPVIAEQTGIASNKNFNESLSISENIEGIDQYAKVINIVGGVDIETDEVFRDRIIDFIRNPAPAWTDGNISRHLMNKIPSLKNVWTKTNKETYHISVYGLNNNWGLTDEEKETMHLHLLDIRPVNFKDSDITIDGAVVEVINVKIQDLRPTTEEAEKEVTKNIEYFFQRDFFNKEIKKNELESVVYNTFVGIDRIEDFKLIDGWAGVKEKTTYRLGNIEYV